MRTQSRKATTALDAGLEIAVGGLLTRAQDAQFVEVLLSPPSTMRFITGTDDQLKAIRETTKILEEREIPEWLDVSADKLSAEIKRLPEKKDIGMTIEENLIVELYSK